VPELSIIVLSYNVRDLLVSCLESIYADKRSSHWQIIVVDNASTDGSVEEVTRRFPKVELIKSVKNLGFSAGNNLGVKKATSDLLLFLNPDTLIIDKAISGTLDYLKNKPEVGAISCRVELPDGQLDYSSHRGLPTPWNALSYFLGLAKLFPQSSWFSGYTATYLDLESVHEVECITGAFFLVRRVAAEKFGWWDEDYFWNGEDIEFCYRLKQSGWKIVYYPKEKIIHYKGSSAKQNRLETAKRQTAAMRTFFTKHYPSSGFILSGIWLLEKFRLAKAKYA
jgi:GT2 family glycosyltransferase